MKVNNCISCGDKNLKKVTKRIDDNAILRCAKCKIMMVEHLQDDTEAMYTIDYFEKDQDTKFGYSDYVSSPVTTLVGKFGFARLFADEKAVHLDLGSADGSLMEIFKAEGHETHGLEISQDAVDTSISKGLNVIQSNLKGFPKTTPKADVITAYDLLEHADAPGMVVEGVYENLNDDGFFVFSTLSVDVKNPDDHWLNNSLEHYTYFDEQALSNLLGNIFGPGNFAFKEIVNNGIAEFWGFAKKGSITDEKELVDTLGETPKRLENAKAYMLSLFYNQVSMFEQSQKLIDSFSNKWGTERALEAQFYNYYFQGKFAKALDLHESAKSYPRLGAVVYWQGLQYVARAMMRIKVEEHKEHYRSDISDFNTKVGVLEKQKLRNEDSIKVLEAELKGLRGSRLIGSVIKAAHLKALLFEDIRLNKGAGIRRKLYRKTIERPYLRMRNAYVRKRLKYDVQDNSKKDTKNPLVTVVIPFYNRDEIVLENLDSLAKQTFTDFDVILVNDGSTNKKSLELLKTLPKHPTKPKVITKKNGGVASARNTGIEAAKSRYVMVLDDDDTVGTTFIEKCLLILESDPSVSYVTSGIQAFGASSWTHLHQPYNAAQLFAVNLASSCSVFRKTAWEDVSGYKNDLGYEDWDLWISMAEQGHWGRAIPEALFNYRTAASSRYIEDKANHDKNVKKIHSLHPGYYKKVKEVSKERRYIKKIVNPPTSFMNMASGKSYKTNTDKKPHAVLLMPWMTFGGAETLILNFSRELVDEYKITFMTGLTSDHVWQDRFEEISRDIYHLPNMFDSPAVYLEFVSNYIQTRGVEILHLLHTDFAHFMLEELRRRHPKLKIILTMFNSRVDHFSKIEGKKQFFDMLSSDNTNVAADYEEIGIEKSKIAIIPNGIDSAGTFNSDNYDKTSLRQELGLTDDNVAVFFVGRLSPEKNPDVFLDVAQSFESESDYKKLKFFVVGNGVMTDQVEKSVKAVSNIEYLGYRSDIAQMLLVADIFVLPSSIEGFPLSILEAMAMNTVCIASRVGAVPDVIEDAKNGFVVAPGSVDEIAQKVALLHDDNAELQRMQALSREEVTKKYSSEILGKNYKRMYKRLIK